MTELDPASTHTRIYEAQHTPGGPEMRQVFPPPQDGSAPTLTGKEVPNIYTQTEFLGHSFFPHRGNNQSTGFNIVRRGLSRDENFTLETTHWQPPLIDANTTMHRPTAAGYAKIAQIIEARAKQSPTGIPAKPPITIVLF